MSPAKVFTVNSGLVPLLPLNSDSKDTFALKGFEYYCQVVPKQSRVSKAFAELNPT